MEPPSPDVTGLLRAWGSDDGTSREALVSLVYGELRRQAELQMRRQAVDHTLQPTALVHEAYLRLASTAGAPFESRTHFFGVAAQVMRSVLVDHARAQLTAKRGGGAVCVTLGAADRVAPMPDDVDVLALDGALARLAELDAQKSRVVELRYFVGLTVEETAEAIGVSPATVKRAWTAARAWLKRELADTP